MSVLKFIWGPKLFLKYKERGTATFLYEETGIECVSSRFISCLRASGYMVYWCAPVVLLLLYRRNLLTTPDGLQYMARFTAVLAGLYYLAHITRGIGRMQNTMYKSFMTELTSFQSGQLSRQNITKYDFDFSAWPVDFSLKSSSSRRGITHELYIPSTASRTALSDRIKLIPCRILSYVAASSFGRWMLYPGSTALLNSMIEQALLDGRTQLVENKAGQRYKLETVEGNHIDSMFMDRRHDDTNAGNTLIICSEGNAAFYEAGCMNAPLNLGYSILGWNHPGFGSSTGQPYPEQEHNGIDCVVQFAIKELGFSVHQIIFYSWSIGGYASTWAAANYPECKAVILDATFDDVLPLAKPRMPEALEGVVVMTIRQYFNLDIAGWLNKYNGPVRLIRRTQDEMISTNPQNISTNRGNVLLKKLLSHRYPHIVTEESLQVLDRWLAGTGPTQTHLMEEIDVDDEQCRQTLLSLYVEEDASIPLEYGEDLPSQTKSQLTIYLASRHMTDVVSTHCVPLPEDSFGLPWELQYKQVENSGE